MSKAKKENSDWLQYSNWQFIKDLWIFIRPYRRRFWLSSILRLTSDISALYPSYAFALIVTFFSKYTFGASLKYFWIIIGLWAIMNSIKTISRQLAKYFGFQLAERTALDAQQKTIQHFFALDISWHEKEYSGNKLKRIQKGGEAIEQIIRMWISNAIEIAVNFIGMIFILGYTDHNVGFIMLIFLITYFIMSFGFLKKARETSQLVDEEDEEIMGLIFQAINNIRSVKVAGMAGSIIKILSEKISHIFIIIRRRIFLFQTRAWLLDTWSITFRLGIMIIIGYGIIHGQYAVGFLILFNGYFNSIVSSVAELSDVTQDFIVRKYSFARMMNTINEPITIDNERGKINFPKNWKKISIKNLHFSYGSHKVLDNLSFDIRRGERIGIVGMSGVGKSTLFKLLLKENENYQGEILIDDLPLKQIKKSSYYTQTGVVLQDTEVFSFSLRDNITIASARQPNSKDLKEALNTAHINNFLHKLPEGIDTIIGEKGIRLSGGEKQRLGIARAIYKKPQLLFLDEATSHLDMESEEQIRDSLQFFFQKVTAVVIAHRLTTIRNMDKILVMEKGRVVESGNFNELYDRKGKFYNLWEKQKL